MQKWFLSISSHLSFSYMSTTLAEPHPPPLPPGREADLSAAFQGWPLFACLSLHHVNCRPRLEPLLVPLLSPPSPPEAAIAPSSSGPSVPPAAASKRLSVAATTSRPNTASAPADAAAAGRDVGGPQLQGRHMQRLVLRFCPSVGAGLVRLLQLLSAGGGAGRARCGMLRCRHWGCGACTGRSGACSST